MSLGFNREVPRLLSAIEYQQKLLGPAGDVVVAMERTGVCVDLKILADIRDKMATRAGEILDDLADWTPREINWNSWVQLQDWLHIPGPIGLGLDPSPYNKKGEVQDGKVATDDRAL